MKANTTNNDEFEALERASGIPPKGSMGASKRELYALAIGVVVFLAIIVAFVLEST